MLMLTLTVAVMAQGWRANYNGVMLQGFYWDSYTDTKWTNLQAQADELAEYFNLIWIPNSANCNTSHNVMGYAPVYWFNQNSSFGTETELRSMINTFRNKGVGLIEDVVINHRNGVNSYTDFPSEIYRDVTYQLTSADICATDECVANGFEATGAADTGENWDGMRDLDHTSANVQNNVKAYLGMLKDDLGYVGFRYDYVKGFAPEYVGLYNSASNVEYSVGEYWDGNLSLVKKWIEGTRQNGSIQSAAFDFPLKYNINEACNKGNWTALAKGGLTTESDYSRYSVTFVDNHDSYRDDNACKDNIEAANAFILSIPGTPCLFLNHWKKYKESIKQMITARKLAGITNQSASVQVASSAMGYSRETTGTRGKLFIALKSTSAGSDEYVNILSGQNYKMYISKNVESAWVGKPSGEYDNAIDVKLTALSLDASAKLVYTTDGTEPAAQSNVAESGTSIHISESTMLKAGLLINGSVTGVVTRNYEIKPFAAHKAVVYLKNPSWTKVHFYAWDDAGQLNGEWPGGEVTDKKMINGTEWYFKSFDVNKSTYSFNIIFSQGSSSNQTVDIGPISDDRYYEIGEKVNGKYTYIDVTSQITGIDNITQDRYADGAIKVYDIDGRLVRSCDRHAGIAEALQGLDRGLYIIGKKKYVVN